MSGALSARTFKNFFLSFGFFHILEESCLICLDIVSILSYILLKSLLDKTLILFSDFNKLVPINPHLARPRKVVHYFFYKSVLEKIYSEYDLISFYLDLQLSQKLYLLFFYHFLENQTLIYFV